LFGHEKGAFTGAHYRKAGLVEAARGGTLFLDQVGDIPLPLQVKLLRLMETRTFRPVGSVEVRQADFRLVCATHQDLPALVADGRFRADLYYRIATFPIRLPPVRERSGDLPHLVRSLLQRSAQGQGKSLSES
ncbi:MAG: sigma 54-interacting transcriptional regulator, partial [Thiohalorhabdaceae bacterium]